MRRSTARLPAANPGARRAAGGPLGRAGRSACLLGSMLLGSLSCLAAEPGAGSAQALDALVRRGDDQPAAALAACKTAPHLHERSL